MNLFLTLLFFTLANICVYSYATLSKNTSFSDWKIFILPLLFFPIIYVLNVFFSLAWIQSNKTLLPVAVIGILNIVSYVLIFLLGDIFYLKQHISLQTLIGVVLILFGAALITFK